MKKLGKIFLYISIVAYAIIAMFLTVCLLKYNDYKVSVFGDTSLIIVGDDTLNENYKKGSLLIVEKDQKSIKKGDSILFYNTHSNQVNIAVSKVFKMEKITDTETTYTVSGNLDISSEYLIGSTKNVKIIPVLGTIIGVLESRIGFLIFIIFPITLAFLYEIYILVSEIKEVKEETKKAEEEKEKKKKNEKKKK